MYIEQKIEVFFVLMILSAIVFFFVKSTKSRCLSALICVSAGFFMFMNICFKSDADEFVFKSANCDDESYLKFRIDRGANFNMKDKRGDTPLIIGATNGRIKVVKYLLKLGADKNIRNNSGISACDAALMRDDKVIADLLSCK
nr:ankyrin repeat domain-containing protein [Armatimonas sp.]